MGSGEWFKTILSLKKVKEDKSKQGKVQSTTKKSNSSKWRHLTGKEFRNLGNGASNRNAGVLSFPIEHIAAKRIQTAFRAYRARKALHLMKGTERFQALFEGHTVKNQAHRMKVTERFQALFEGHTVKNQASATLNHIHAWSKIQAQIRARRLSMVTEGRIRQKKLENQLKLEAKLHELEVEWCGGSDTMEEILSRLQQREEAAVKRERAMAYAFSHQWRANSTQYFGQAYYDLGKESWGWSWIERWIAVRPWETRVHAHSIIPRKVQARNGSKVGKTTNHAETKTIVSVKPTLSNGKGATKSRKLSNSTAEKQASQELISPFQSETDEAKIKQEQFIA